MEFQGSAKKPNSSMLIQQQKNGNEKECFHIGRVVCLYYCRKTFNLIALFHLMSDLIHGNNNKTNHGMNKMLSITRTHTHNVHAHINHCYVRKTQN